MNKIKYILIGLFVSVIITFVTLTITLYQVDRKYYSILKNIDTTTNIESSVLINKINSKNKNLIYYKNTLRYITNNLTIEESINIINTSNKISLFDRYNLFFKYIINIKRNNNSNKIKIDLLNKEFIADVVPLLYDLDNRLDDYNEIDIKLYESTINNLINKDIKIADTRDTLKFLGDITYELTNFNKVLSYIINDIYNTSYNIDKTSYLINCISYHFQNINSEIMLELIDAIKSSNENIIVYIFKNIYSSSVELSIIEKINEEFIFITNMFDINIDFNLTQLGKYLYENNIKEFNKINDVIIKDNIKKLNNINHPFK